MENESLAEIASETVQTVPIAACLPVILLLLIAAAMIASRRWMGFDGLIAVVGLLGTTAVLIYLAQGVFSGNIAITVFDAGLGIPVSYIADGLAVAFSLVATLSVLAASVVAVAGPAPVRDAYPLLLILLAGAIGLFLAGDLFSVFVWSEVVFAAAIALSFKDAGRARRAGAWLIVFGLAGSFLFLAAIIGIFARFGTVDFAELTIRVSGQIDRRPAAALAGVACLALLVKAVCAPLLYSAGSRFRPTSIAATSACGVVLIGIASLSATLRVMVLIMPDIRASLADSLVGASIVMMGLGGIGVARVLSINRLLSWIVLVIFGTALSGIAVGSEFGVAGTIFLTLHATVVVTGLYLAAAVIASGPASVPSRLMLVVSGSFFVLLVSISGLPPFAGFWSRVLIVQAAFVDGRVILAGAVLASGLAVSLGVLRAYVRGVGGVRKGLLQGRVDGAPVRAAEALPVAALALISLVFGLWPVPVVNLVDRATGAVLNSQAYAELVSGATR